MVEKFFQLQKKPTTILLIFANLVPIIGILFFNWEVFQIMLLYWFESAIIGFYTICKMVVIGVLRKEITFKKKNDPSGNQTVRGAGVLFSLLFLAAFFCFHYGMFMYVHLNFVFAIFGSEGPLTTTTEPMSLQLIYSLLTGVWVAMAVLFISHGISFLKNFIGNKEYERVNTTFIMFSPYKRIILMHLTLIFGGMLVMFFKLPVVGLILMIALKVFFDMNAHIKEHVFKKMEREFVQIPHIPKKRSRHAPVVIFFIIVVFAVVIIFSAVNQDDNQELLNNTSKNNMADTGIQLSTKDTIVFDKDNNLIMTDLYWDEKESRFLMTTDGSMMELWIDDKNVIDWNKSFASMTGDYILRGWAGDYIVNKVAMKIDKNQGGAWPLDKEQKDPSALTQQGQYLWVADSATNKLYKYDINQNYTLVNSYPAAGTAVVGVAWDGANLWSADASVSYKYNADMTVGERFNLPVLISGLTVRNNELWATAYSESKIFNISVLLK